MRFGALTSPNAPKCTQMHPNAPKCTRAPTKQECSAEHRVGRAIRVSDLEALRSHVGQQGLYITSQTAIIHSSSTYPCLSSDAQFLPAFICFHRPSFASTRPSFASTRVAESAFAAFGGFSAAAFVWALRIGHCELLFPGRTSRIKSVAYLIEQFKDHT